MLIDSSSDSCRPQGFEEGDGNLAFCTLGSACSSSDSCRRGKTLKYCGDYILNMYIADCLNTFAYNCMCYWHTCRDGYAQVIYGPSTLHTVIYQQTTHTMDWQHCICNLIYIASCTLPTVAAAHGMPSASHNKTYMCMCCA
jgi:hypothetical protein